MSDTVLAVDLGGTQLRVALVAADGEVLERRAQPTPADDPDALPRAMRALLAEAGREVAGAVVGVPSVVDYATGIAGRTPNLRRWEGHLSAPALASMVGLPVAFANDADLAALGEHRFGAGRGVDDMVYVTVSTGIGAGVVLGGRLLHGRRSGAELGYTVVDYRTGATLESLAAGAALERLSGLPGAEVTRRAAAGDAQALGWFEELAAPLAAGLVNAIECYAPQRVVVGGGVSQAGDLLFGPLRARIATSAAAEHFDPAELVPAAAGDDVGLRGAAALWRDIESPPEARVRLRAFAPS